MKQIHCRVERMDEYKVEFDENVMNEQWMDDFRQVYYDFDSLEEHAEHLAQYRARFGRGFIEGYGVPLENGKPPYWGNEKDINHAINIVIMSEDDDIDTYTIN